MQKLLKTTAVILTLGFAQTAAAQTPSRAEKVVQWADKEVNAYEYDSSELDAVQKHFSAEVGAKIQTYFDAGPTDTESKKTIRKELSDALSVKVAQEVGAERCFVIPSTFGAWGFDFHCQQRVNDLTSKRTTVAVFPSLKHKDGLFGPEKGIYTIEMLGGDIKSKKLESPDELLKDASVFGRLSGTYKISGEPVFKRKLTDLHFSSEDDRFSATLILTEKSAGEKVTDRFYGVDSSIKKSQPQNKERLIQALQEILADDPVEAVTPHAPSETESTRE